MPRYNKSKRGSIKKSLNSYSLLNDFTSYVGDYEYKSSSTLLLHTDFCDPLNNISGNQTSWNNRVNSSTHIARASPDASMYVTNIDTFCGPACGIVIKSGGSSQGDSGSAYSSNMYFYFADHNDLSFGNSSSDSSFTISFWYQSGSPNSGWTNSGVPSTYFFRKNNEYSLAMGGDGKIRFSLFDNGTSPNLHAASSANQLVAGQWNHITITYDGSSTSAGMKIYANGENITNSYPSAVGSYSAMHNLTDPLYFGFGGVSGTSLPSCELTEPAIWTSALPDEEIKAIYNGTLNCAEAQGWDSGYINLSPRILIRQRDNATGSYPTNLRMSSRDRRGNYSVAPFNDKYTQIFGRKIKNNFTIDNQLLSFKNFKDNFDLKTSPGMKIKRESFKDKNGEMKYGSVLVFSGLGDGNQDRWIQTRIKIRNPEVSFNLIQGPYNKQSKDLVGLDLKSGIATEVLKLQISENGSSWKTIDTLTPSLDGKPVLRKDKSLQINERIRIHKTYKAKDFNSYTDFYFRIIQESYAKIRKSVWAIDNLEIISRNQSVRYPILIDHDGEAGKKADNDFIATPHTRSDIVATGSSISGISDTMLKFTPGENLSPFDDTLHVTAGDSNFLKSGIDQNLYPGFSQQLSDKTTIIVDLSPSEPTTFGYEKKVILALIGADEKQSLMVYWNNVLKRWEKVSKGYQVNNASNKTESDMMHSVTSSAVGFGPIGHITSGSSYKVLTGSAIDNYARPVTTFNFPFDGRYHATGSQIVTAKSLGIVKPFLFEKAILKFTSNFEFADDGLIATDSAFRLKHFSSSNGPDSFTRDPGLKYYLPTFFMLRQFNDNFRIDNVAKFEVTGTYHEFEHATIIPGYYDLNGSGIKNSMVRDNRELISYGQLGIMLSGSNLGAIEVDDILDAGLKRESLIILNGSNHNQLSGTFSIPFKCRKTQLYNNAATTALWNLTSSPFLTASLLTNNNVMKNYLEPAARRLMNQNPVFASKPPKNLLSIPSKQTAGIFNNSVLNDISIDLPAPYIIFPEDKLILGWQYPMSDNTAQYTPNIANSFRNMMTLISGSKLFLYGSQLKMNKEYHDRVNQHLTTNNLHHAIGDDPVTDQFDIAKINEYTGSFFDHVPIGNSSLHTWLDSGTYIGSELTENPVKRVGTYAGSYLNITESLKANSIAYPAGEYILKKRTKSIQRFTNLRDSNREFFDDKSPGYFVQDSLYGITSGSKSPKYYYNSKKFGQFADLFMQGRDGYFELVDSEKEYNLGTSKPAIEKIFVSGSISSGDETFAASGMLVRYYKVDQVASSSLLKSNNLSLYATSSKPYHTA